MAKSDVQSRIRANVWQAIAENNVDLGALDAQTRENLVNLVTAASLEAMDEEISAVLAANEDKLKPAEVLEAEAELADEEVLWEGRPFLSISEYYLITNERLRVASGLIGRSYQNIDLVRVQDVDYRQSTGERMIGRGDIEVRSHDPQSPLVVLENIKNPEEVYDILRRAVKKARKDHGLTFQEEM